RVTGTPENSFLSSGNAFGFGAGFGAAAVLSGLTNLNFIRHPAWYLSSGIVIGTFSLYKWVRQPSTPDSASPYSTFSGAGASLLLCGFIFQAHYNRGGAVGQGMTKAILLLGGALIAGASGVGLLVTKP
ncbi:MAG: hypothetical protein HY542_07050, partial [Deltaproteobacteria bacterium]|nr:hypothetical protein [Deltaproteobacteria bacterium]